MGLDEAKAKAALNAVADRITYPPFSPYKVAVSIPNNDTPVTLTLKLTYNGREDLYVSRVYSITLKSGVEQKDVDYQELLDTMLKNEDALTNPRNGSNIDKANVASDIQFFTTRDLGRLSMELYNKGFDGKYTPIKITDSNEDVISSTDIYICCARAYIPPASGPSSPKGHR